MYMHVAITCTYMPHVVAMQLRGAASMHDLVDAGMVELGMTKNPQPGIKNPLAVMTKMVGGEEVLISPGGSDFDSPAEVG